MGSKEFTVHTNIEKATFSIKLRELTERREKMSRKKWFKYSVFLTAIFLIMSIVSLSASAEKPLVAVMPFEEGDLSWKGFRGDEILNGITQQVTNKLSEKEGVRVIERSRIDEIIVEQDLGASGRVDPTTAAEIGEIIGVETMIMGTLTRMEVKETGGIEVGPLEAKQLKAVVKLSGRVVDTSTAEIFNTFRNTAEESKESVEISISELKGLTFNTEAFANSVLGISIDQATSQFVNNITPDALETEEREESEKLQGEVVEVLNGKLVINIGRNQDLLEKQRGELTRKIDVEGVSDKVTLPIGTVKVISLDDNAAVVRVIETEEDESPQKGDKVSFELK